jgi:hypothetical protein
MKVPNLTRLERNLRETLVLKAEELSIIAGSEVGAQLVSALTGLNDVHGLPTDWFAAENELELIDIDRLAITACIRDLHARLETHSLGMSVDDGRISCEEIEQDDLDPIELYLSSLPDVALAAYDWTGCRNGAVKELFLLGRAWKHLIEALDYGSKGDFDFEPLTVSDVALLAGIEERSLRNKVGKNGPLRSVDQYRERKSPVSQRGFVAIDRFDAIDWLLSRKGFELGRIRPGLVASRLERISDPIVKGRAALMSAMALGKNFEIVAAETGISTELLKALGDGLGSSEVAQGVAEFVAEHEMKRSSNTASAE